MKHVFTNREKILLVILAVLLIAVGYWKLILTPINDSIDALRQQTASEQDALIQDSARAVLDALHDSQYVNLISDLNMDLKGSTVRTTLSLTYFELQK